jgi:hypothetical protein
MRPAAQRPLPPYGGVKNKWCFSEKMLKSLLTYADNYNILKA